MRVLVACEFSGTVRDAFRALGHDAWSCDLVPCEKGDFFHYQKDIITLLDQDSKWDLMIAHPPCTYLASTGAKWFKPEYAERFPNRHEQREQAAEFFLFLADYAGIPRICVENPVGVMSTRYRKPDQIIQPFQFGHPEPKKTCLWLKNLPLLVPTEIVEPEYTTTKSGKRVPTWFFSPSPSAERQKTRNRTFRGIAEAMAAQWGII